MQIDEFDEFGTKTTEFVNDNYNNKWFPINTRTGHFQVVQILIVLDIVT